MSFNTKILIKGIPGVIQPTNVTPLARTRPLTPLCIHANILIRKMTAVV